MFDSYVHSVSKIWRVVRSEGTVIEGNRDATGRGQLLRFQDGHLILNFQKGVWDCWASQGQELEYKLQQIKKYAWFIPYLPDE